MATSTEKCTSQISTIAPESPNTGYCGGQPSGGTAVDKTTLPMIPLPEFLVLTLLLGLQQVANCDCQQETQQQDILLVELLQVMAHQ